MSLALNVQSSDSKATDGLQSVLIITQSAPVGERLRAFLERAGLTVIGRNSPTPEVSAGPGRT